MGAVLLAGLLVNAAPASAGEIRGFLLERADGMPTTSEPALTITHADLDLTLSSTDRLHAVVRLGAEPTEATDADLNLHLGRFESGSCTVEWSDQFSTYAPGEAAVREGDRLTVDRVIEDGAGPWDCASVSLTDPEDGEIVHDRYDGEVSSIAYFDALGLARITDVHHRRLEVGEWSFVRVEIRNRGYELTKLRVGGHGDGLLVGRVRVGGIIDHGERLVVKLPVKLRDDRAADLRVTTRPYGDLYIAQRDRVRVTVRPAR